MSATLDEVERRVLGVLLEKALAQPAYYPMTLNAIVAACNQKSNRDPVMDLDEDTVFDALERLRAVGMISRVLASTGRVDRFRHETREFFGWEKPDRAVIAELLLRGPQTVGELRTRCSRMTPFADQQAVIAVLDKLAQADPPLVATMPREPGRSAVRHMHLLYSDDERPAPAAPAPAAPSRPPTAPAAAAFTNQPVASESQLQALQSQMATMQAELSDLRETLAQLRRRIDELESRLH